MFFLKKWWLDLQYGRGYADLLESKNRKPIVGYGDLSHALHNKQRSVLIKTERSSETQQAKASKRSYSHQNKKLYHQDHNSNYDPIKFFENTNAIEYRILDFLKGRRKSTFKDIFENQLKEIYTDSIRSKARSRKDIQNIIDSCLSNLEKREKIYFDRHHKSWYIQMAKLKKISQKEKNYLKAHGLGEGWKNIPDETHAINWMHSKFTPDDFEAFCCALLEHAKVKNLNVSEKRNSGADGGLDGYGELKINGQVQKVLIEAKRYKIDNQVTTDLIQKFIGVLEFENLKYGFYITTSIFSERAIEKCTELNKRENSTKKIELINKDRIIDIMLSKGKNPKGFGLYRTPDLNRLFINTTILKNALDKYK